MRVDLNSYFNPWSEDHHGLKNFKVIPQSEQIKAVMFTALAGILSFGILALPVFRILTKSSTPLADKVEKVWDKTMPSPKDPDGRTELHYAIFQKDLDFVKSLVKKGADINAKDHKGFTALNYAMMDRKVEMFEYFIENGGDVNSKNHLGMSLLALAIVSKKFDFAEILIKKRASLEDCDSQGTSALHLACLGGHMEAIRLLLEAGASPDQHNKAGMSPLALARIKRVENYEEIKELFSEISPLSISYEREFIHRRVIGHAFSLSGTTPFFPKEGGDIQKVPLERSIPIPFFWEELEKSYIQECPDKKKLIVEALEFAKNTHSPHELFRQWKEGKPVFIDMGYQNHYICGLLSNDQLILIDRAAQGKKVRVEKVRKDRMTEETIRLMQGLARKEYSDYTNFMHQEFPNRYCFKQTSTEKDLEAKANQLIDHQKVNNCTWANREGAVTILSNSWSLPLLQKCYFAEEYLKTIRNEKHSYYPSPLFLAQMADHLRKEREKVSDPQVKERVEKSIRGLEVEFASLQSIPSKSMPPEWKEEMKQARQVLYPYVSLLKSKRK